MIRPRSSLVGRLIFPLIIIQSVLSLIALMISLLYWQQPGDEYAFSQIHLQNLVVDALAKQPDGGLAITDTPALADFRAARPKVRIAALLGRQPLQGSSADLVAALEALGFPDFANATFSLTQGPLAGAMVAASVADTRWGAIVVVSTDNTLQSADLPALVGYMSSYLVRVMVLVLLGAALIVPLVVTQALRPLRNAARDAARIDLRSRDFRLPDGKGVPSELLPFIRSINAALDRLDDGFSRQQRYAAEAAHELRTPLGVLAARIDSLPESPVARGLRRDAERMRTLVDQLLFVAWLETRHVLPDESLDLTAVARGVVADCAPLAIAQGRDIALTPEAEHLPIRGNTRAVESAITNLVQNAVRAEPQGGTVEVVARAPAEILVIDHGTGIAAAERDRVFEPFWRRDEHHPGAGLGLTIVKEAAAAHGGTVTVEDTPGGGATFRLTLSGTTAGP
ncbi:cell wall metabolism sensor histidine kinase WalK [Reyranella sp. CPCC 100927]|uniref:sensor histidine kinase n=1 Tax=Reyranella sp. CPCC 100927 TaxID=2599616 RepID=UPI0011B437E0|nr:HAMP domain-containing sensor histidine kinase [Reyranella sp. CPCC 100927]TWT11532.1 HAMP domain-containing histidine kinase [Reyranella sp. CPCC 100927]